MTGRGLDLKPSKNGFARKSTVATAKGTARGGHHVETNLGAGPTSPYLGASRPTTQSLIRPLSQSLNGEDLVNIQAQRMVEYAARIGAKPIDDAHVYGDMEAELEHAIDRSLAKEGDITALAERIQAFWLNTMTPVKRIQGLWVELREVKSELREILGDWEHPENPPSEGEKPPGVEAPTHETGGGGASFVGRLPSLGARLPSMEDDPPTPMHGAGGQPPLPRFKSMKQQLGDHERVVNMAQVVTGLVNQQEQMERARARARQILALASRPPGRPTAFEEEANADANATIPTPRGHGPIADMFQHAASLRTSLPPGGGVNGSHGGGVAVAGAAWGGVGAHPVPGMLGIVTKPAVLAHLAEMRRQQEAVEAVKAARRAVIWKEINPRMRAQRNVFLLKKYFTAQQIMQGVPGMLDEEDVKDSHEKDQEAAVREAALALVGIDTGAALAPASLLRPGGAKTAREPPRASASQAAHPSGSQQGEGEEGEEDEETLAVR